MINNIRQVHEFMLIDKFSISIYKSNDVRNINEYMRYIIYTFHDRLGE